MTAARCMCTTRPRPASPIVCPSSGITERPTSEPRPSLFPGPPSAGAPPEPLFETADRLGLRWVSFDRPGYGGSTRHPGRTMASVAADVAAVADALGIDQFAVVGHSGGG